MVDANNICQPLERLAVAPAPLYLSGAIYPSEGTMSKTLGRHVAKPFGPVTRWTMQPNTGQPSSGRGTGQKGGVATTAAAAGEGPWKIMVYTSAGAYACSKPLPIFKKLWAGLLEQAQLAWEVEGVLGLHPGQPGDPMASWEEVAAKVARSGAAKGYSSAREALLLNGPFVLQQLEEATATPATAAAEADKGKAAAAAADKGKRKAGVVEGPFVAALREQLAKGPVAVGQLMTGGGITIREPGAAASAQGGDAGENGDAGMTADEEMARRLQAKLDAEAQHGGGSR